MSVTSFIEYISGFTASVLPPLLVAMPVSVLVSALWDKYVSKRMLQRSQAAYNERLAKLEHDFQRAQKQEQAQIDRSLFVTRSQFETEFESMKEVFSCLSEVRLFIVGVRPMWSIELSKRSSQEKYESLMARHTDLVHALNKLLRSAESRAPFYPEPLYLAIGKCIQATQLELNSIKLDGGKALTSCGYIEAQKYYDQFLAGFTESVQLIRNRLASLAILPGS